MKLFAAVLVLCVAFASAEFKEKSEDDFFKASAACAQELKVPEAYLEKFSKFDYPNEEIVRKQIRCVFMKLELWSDDKGYNVEHIADLYKDKANTEVLIPTLSECNKNSANDPILNWAYKGFECILSSQVGQYFRDDISKQQAAAAKA